MSSHIPADPVPPQFNMAAYVLQHALTQPDKCALSILHADRAENWTYQDLAKDVGATAAGLLAAGCQAGDRVLLRLGNVAAFPISYLGCIAVGVIPVPLSAQLTAPEVAKIAANIQPRATIQTDEMATGSDVVIHPNQFKNGPSLPLSAFKMGDPTRPAYIIHTSGTSGQPRAVVHAHRAIWARRMMWEGWYGLRNDDRLLHAGAFNWTYTLGTGLMDPWAIGATALIPADGTAAEALPSLMAQHEATLFAAAPGVYRRMLRGNFPTLPALRHGLCAGEKLPEETAKAWGDITGTPVFEAFGMSECSTFISGSPAQPAPKGSIGYAQAGRSLAIVQDGQPVPRGTAGEIAVHRDDAGLMLGYLNAPADTAAKFRGPWFLTGDQGQMADDGAITYLGRADDMMNAGGYRVSPIEVEDVLGAHPQVSEVAACAVTVKKDVQVIAAFFTSGHRVDVDDLAQWCAARLARYKCPRLFIACDQLPRGANNKLLRRALRQDWETRHGQT